jgi:hypothetical protein
MRDIAVRPILYLSGPYSPTEDSTTEQNIQVARNHAIKAWERGWAAFTPHLNTCGFENLCSGVNHSDWLEGDLAIIQRMDRDRGDAMLMLPGWKNSPGATIERKLALAKGLEVFDPLTSPECLPQPRVAGNCQYHMKICALGVPGDTCTSLEKGCPEGAWCPLKGRCL